MAVSLKHSKTSLKDDGPDSSFVQPSDWNAEHALSLGSGKLVGRVSPGTGLAEEIALGSGLEFSGSNLSVTSLGSLGDINDVALSGIQDGDVLKFTSSGNTWINDRSANLVDGGNF